MKDESTGTIVIQGNIEDCQYIDERGWQIFTNEIDCEHVNYDGICYHAPEGKSVLATS